VSRFFMSNEIELEHLSQMRRNTALAVQYRAMGRPRQSGESMMVRVNYTYRDLLPSDIGRWSIRHVGLQLSNPLNLDAAGVQRDLYEGAPLPSDTAVAVFGFGVPAGEPSPISELYLDGDHSRYAAFSVGRLACLPSEVLTSEGQITRSQARVGYFFDPVYFGPGERIQIGLGVARETRAGDASYYLIGYVGEPNGKSVVNRQVQ